jgi:hypothetical protein
MFTDCLLDGKMMPLYNNSPEAVKAFLEKNHPLPASFRVYIGSEDKIVTIEEYLERAKND